MKWFKHDADANLDAKLQNVLLDYGLEGYGLFWYCLEMIVNKVSQENISFELEHDARIIARNTGSTAQKVSEMMEYFVEQGLFENADGTITCLKLAKRLDKSMTSNPEMRSIIGKLNESGQLCTTLDSKSHDSIMTKSGIVMQDKTRLDKTRIKLGDFDSNLSFDVFWKAYPRKIGKGNAKTRFKNKVKSDDKFKAVMTGLKNHLPLWAKTDSQFIPHAATWLNGDRWEDEVEMPSQMQQVGRMTESQLVEFCDSKGMSTIGLTKDQLLSKVQKFREKVA